mmetsp:Transcript_22565/g.49921  ORF Transcript_22565/g.49921 Transcript_22565/m.49921 type:complete len:210 (+) Transcript_22565:416-1045(+)
MLGSELLAGAPGTVEVLRQALQQLRYLVLEVCPAPHDILLRHPAALVAGQDLQVGAFGSHPLAVPSAAIIRTGEAPGVISESLAPRTATDELPVTGELRCSVLERMGQLRVTEVADEDLVPCPNRLDANHLARPVLGRNDASVGGAGVVHLGDERIDQLIAVVWLRVVSIIGQHQHGLNYRGALIGLLDCRLTPLRVVADQPLIRSSAV